MYRYETHMHTAPVSKCACATVEKMLEFYKERGYDGVFVTNHFLDGNININSAATYEEKINFYFSDYEKALIYGKKMGIKVFCAIESSFWGTDFIILGLGKQWFLDHPEWQGMQRSVLLSFLAESGAFVVQAHPFREAEYIDHIRLFPRLVHGVEVINAATSDTANKMAQLYADEYGLLCTAGSDAHHARNKRLAGIETDEPLNSVQDYIDALKQGKTRIFVTEKSTEE